MSDPREELRALFKELLIESIRGIDWSDAGFTEDEEARINKHKPNFRKDISLVAIVDPTTNPMNLGSAIGNVGVLDTGGNRVDPKTDDPIMSFADSMDIGVTYDKRTTPVFKMLHAVPTTAGNYMTLESPVGTDYSVAANKVFNTLKTIFNMGVAGMFSIGYGDNSVANGVTAPTNPVSILGDEVAGVSALAAAVANTLYEVKVWAEVPAGKFPFVKTHNTNLRVAVFGVEVDA